ncbi:MAG: YajQ family cyclic di-GMP-binding protein [Proteobacteria bacterium]|nr:YajQ family cyclic di-GMP-binding protein [Pseudomonadota bacterium]
MPSFDVVCELDLHELGNAIDQSNREIETRFDFKGVDASFSQVSNRISVRAETEFQINQMMDILKKKLTKRNVHLSHMQLEPPVFTSSSAEQEVVMQKGINSDIAKKIVKYLKDSKLKIQASIQGEQVRVSGAKKDDLQAAIALLRKQDFNLPLQFINFRD